MLSLSTTEGQPVEKAPMFPRLISQDAKSFATNATDFKQEKHSQAYKNSSTEYYDTTPIAGDNSVRYTSEKPYTNEDFSILVTKESYGAKAKSPAPVFERPKHSKKLITVQPSPPVFLIKNTNL